MSPSLQVVLESDSPQTLRLAEKPIGRGGQAVVYVSEVDPALAIKLYHRPSADVERRLQGMLRLAHADDFLTKDGAAHPELAWPVAVVRSMDDRKVIGYAMRRVGTPEFVPLGVLFNHRQRREAISEVSWRFFVGVARNLTGLMATLHERGLVLGDVSHANVVVSRQGYLTFLDCDSMQFVAPRSNERFPCLVMTPEYAAPELLRNGRLERTPHSDCFSLAVLACQLLLVGDNPFMGVRRYAAEDDESGTTENIRDGYSYLVRPEEIGVPRGAFDLGVLPPAILQLARRTFGEGHSDPTARPGAAEWLAALDEARADLAVCPDVRVHVFGRHLAACPWCARTAAGHSDPFTWKPAPTQRPAVPVPPRQPAPASPSLPAETTEPSIGTVRVIVIVTMIMIVILLLILL